MTEFSLLFATNLCQIDSSRIDFYEMQMKFEFRSEHLA